VTPQAAQELLDLIMLEDFVARRKALDAWTRRWIATARVDFIADGQEALKVEAENSRQLIAKHILTGEIPLFNFKLDRAPTLGLTAVRGFVQIHVVRSKPHGDENL
jgi:hypothetical protein